MFRVLFLGLLMLFMVGCAGVPESLQTQSESPITDFQLIRENPTLVQDQEVRIGGIIAAIHNEKQRTRIEIVSLPLTSDGRPKLDAKPQGRFVGYADGFIEPLEYRPGRLVTIVGRVNGHEQGSVGEFEYRFPVVNISGHQLWQVKQEIRIDDFARYHDCIGTRCSLMSYGVGFTWGEVTQRVTK